MAAKHASPSHHDRMALVRSLLAHAMVAHQDAMDNGPGGPATMAGPMPAAAAPPPSMGPPVAQPISRKPTAAFPFGHFSKRR